MNTVVVCYCHEDCPTCHGNEVGTVAHHSTTHIHVEDIRAALRVEGVKE